MNAGLCLTDLSVFYAVEFVLYVPPPLTQSFSVFCSSQFIWHIMCLSGMEAPELGRAELQPYVFLSLLCHRDPVASNTGH